VHLDVSVPGAHTEFDLARTRAAALVAAGATLVEERHDRMSRWIVLTDPEGNELCLQ